MKTIQSYKLKSASMKFKKLGISSGYSRFVKDTTGGKDWMYDITFKTEQSERIFENINRLDCRTLNAYLRNCRKVVKENLSIKARCIKSNYPVEEIYIKFGDVGSIKVTENKIAYQIGYSRNNYAKCSILKIN